MSGSNHFPSCFRRPSCEDDRGFTPPPSPAPVSGDPNETTCLYQTHLGIFSLKWSRTFLGHYSLHLHFQPHGSFSDYSSPIYLSSPITFRLTIKPLTFWRRSGSKKIPTSNDSRNIRVFWDLTRVKFGSGSEPRSGFYLAVVIDGEMCLLVGDCSKEAYLRTRATTQRVPQALFLRREHVIGNGVFHTNARFGGKNREIRVDCWVDDDEDARLCFKVDDKRVLQIKRLKWKFRGNEKIEVGGIPIQICWDVYNWLFDSNNGHAVLVFKFENKEEDKEEGIGTSDKNGAVAPRKSPNGFAEEWRKMRRRLLKSGRSPSPVSMSSSASSVGGSSVMEWATSSADESELGSDAAGGVGFTLLLYAWRR